MDEKQSWDALVEMSARINKEELRINFARAKEYMTAYEIADTMLQAFDEEELQLIWEKLRMKFRNL